MNVKYLHKSLPELDLGSETTENVRGAARAATELYGVQFVAGHLLNAKLGGSGNDKENITAFTDTSNKQHLHNTENYVKSFVKQNYWIHYEVDAKVRLPDNNLAQKMTTKWWLLDNKLGQATPYPTTPASTRCTCKLTFPRASSRQTA